MTSVDMVRLIQRTFPCDYVNSKNQQRSLVLLPKEYISDYATLLMSDDYNRNIDFNFSSSFKRSDLESLLYKMTENYFNPGYKFKDFRVLLIDTATKKFIGCCVLCFSIEYWGGLPFPFPGDLPNPGIKHTSPASPAWQVDSLPLCHLGSPHIRVMLKVTEGRAGRGAGFLSFWELRTDPVVRALHQPLGC